MISLNCVVFGSKICFSFSFCSDFNLEETVVKTDEIRGLKQFKTKFFQNNNSKIMNEIEPWAPIDQRGHHKLLEADLLANEIITSRK